MGAYCGVSSIRGYREDMGGTIECAHRNPSAVRRKGHILYLQCICSRDSYGLFYYASYNIPLHWLHLCRGYKGDVQLSQRTGWGVVAAGTHESYGPLY